VRLKFERETVLDVRESALAWFTAERSTVRRLMDEVRLRLRLCSGSNSVANRCHRLGSADTPSGRQTRPAARFGRRTFHAIWGADSARHRVAFVQMRSADGVRESAAQHGVALDSRVSAGPLAGREF